MINVSLYPKRGTKLQSRIKAVRTMLHLSQRGFGEKLGVSRDVICNLEYGRVQPNRLFLNHICEVFHVRPEYLFSGEEPVFEEPAAPSPKLEEALKAFRQLDPAYQDYILEQMRALEKLQHRDSEAECL